MKELDAFNAMVRRWADRQPARYRLSALAFGYRCDRKTHSFSQTLEWISKQSRKRKGEGISESTLQRHLRVFEASGVITVERRRINDKNASSVYHVDFDKLIEAEDMSRRQRRRNRQAGQAEDAERQAWLASLGDNAPEPPKHTGDDMRVCEGCLAMPDSKQSVQAHVDGGGDDPWGEGWPTL